jgi:hypothetical protein
MGLFNADIEVRIVLEGCPERGVDALDFRRVRGLPERLDNRMFVRIHGEVSESDYRALLSAGWAADMDSGGGGWIRRNSLRREYDPIASYGHYATVAVRPDHSPVELACLALRACAREQKWSELDGGRMLRELERIDAALRELDAQRAVLVAERERVDTERLGLLAQLDEV